MRDQKPKDSGDMDAYKEELLAERDALKRDISDMENANYELERQIKEVEIELIEKNRTAKELSSKLHDLKKKLITFTTEESNLNSEMGLLETEKGRIISEYNRMSQECGDNISNLGNTILKIDFIKGEIESLRAKIHMTEEAAGQEFGELDSLEEKLSWAAKAFTGLYDNMKGIEKGLKIKYYTKE